VYRCVLTSRYHSVFLNNAYNTDNADIANNYDGDADADTGN